MKPKVSLIWKYFLQESTDNAKCKICSKLYSRKGGGTTSLKNHLRSSHREEFKEFEKAESERESKASKSLNSQNSTGPFKSLSQTKQLSISESISKNDLWSADNPKSMKIDRLVTEMLALQDVSFNFVEGIGFRRLMQVALPKYKLRGRQFFTSNMCDVIYPKMASKIKYLWASFDYLAFTSDVWSEPSSGVSLLSFTCHGIDDKLKRKSLILKCAVLEGSHTGDIISEKFKEMLTEWEIEFEKIHCLVRDGGSNMKKAASNLKLEDIHCTIHVLQLCIRAAVDSVPEVKNLISTCKQVATHFNHSVSAQDRLKGIQEDILNITPALGVIQDCPTRWNSTLYMLNRLLLLKDALGIYACKSKIPHISSEDWENVERLIAILKPFEEATKILSREDESVSCIIPLLAVLKNALESEIDRLANFNILQNVALKLMDELDTRFNSLQDNFIFALATYFDPRYKLKFFNDIIKKKVYCEVLGLIGSMNPPQTFCSCSPPTEKRYRPSSTIGQLFVEMLSSSDEETNESSHDPMKCAKSLLADYAKAKKISIDEDPLSWWMENKKFDKLNKIMRRYLSPPPASVASERLFSGAGLIYDDLRTRLNGEKAAKILFIKYNLPILNFEY